MVEITIAITSNDRPRLSAMRQLHTSLGENRNCKSELPCLSIFLKVFKPRSLA